MEMNDSQVRTMTIPGVPTQNPPAVATAMRDRPMRVVVENVGPTAIRLAFSSSSLGATTSEGVDHFLLLSGRAQVLVLAPKQRLYAVSVGATGSLSVATSDALPFDVVVR
jgi:hypothetical protein